MIFAFGNFSISATNERLTSEAVRNAQKELKPIETALDFIQGDLSAALLSIEHAQFFADGSVTDGLMVAYQQQSIRPRF